MNPETEVRIRDLEERVTVVESMLVRTQVLLVVSFVVVFLIALGIVLNTLGIF